MKSKLYFQKKIFSFSLIIFLMSSFASAYIFDSDSDFGKCFTTHCDSGYDPCWNAKCEPLFSGCSIPCSEVYSNVGCGCEAMCNFIAGETDECANALIASSTGCFSGCPNQDDPWSCGLSCFNSAKIEYNTCVEENRVSECGDFICDADEDCETCEFDCDPCEDEDTETNEFCNFDYSCDTSDGEDCSNCENDCDCYDLICSPGTSGANSWGCFDPCMDIDNSYYESTKDLCVCQPGYILNSDQTNCD